MRTFLTLSFALIALPNFAQSLQSSATSLDDAAEQLVIDNSVAIIESQIETYREHALQLSETAQQFCNGDATPDAVLAEIKASYEAWVAIDMYQFGPIEQRSAVLAVNFWPDKKGYVHAHIAQFENLNEAQKADPNAVRSLSAAAQGLPAAILLTNETKCPEIIGVAANLALFGKELSEDWQGEDGWAKIMRTAGEDNPVYLSNQEVINEIYTAVDFGLQRAYSRLELPLGSFEAPLPNRAEAGEMGWSIDLVSTQLQAIRELVDQGLASEISEADHNKALEAIDLAIEATNTITPPLTDSVGIPDQRFQIELAMQRMSEARDVLAQHVGPKLGVSTGFSAADGD